MKSVGFQAVIHKIRVHIQPWLLVCAALPLLGMTSGCTFRGKLTRLTLERGSAELNCPRHQVQVRRIPSSGYGIYTARGCNQQISYRAMCSGFGECMLKAETVKQHVPTVANPNQGGCRYDTQCKGDRICVKGTCVSPSPRPSSSPSAPPPNK
jgi:hypothetical protein